MLGKDKAVYLRWYSAVPGIRWCAPQPVAGTVGNGTQWHSVSTVDGFSIHSSKGGDIELGIGRTWRPQRFRHTLTTRARAPFAVTSRAIQQVAGVTAVRWS